VCRGLKVPFYDEGSWMRGKEGGLQRQVRGREGRKKGVRGGGFGQVAVRQRGYAGLIGFFQLGRREGGGGHREAFI